MMIYGNMVRWKYGNMAYGLWFKITWNLMDKNKNIYIYVCALRKAIVKWCILTADVPYMSPGTWFMVMVHY